MLDSKTTPASQHEVRSELLKVSKSNFELVKRVSDLESKLEEENLLFEGKSRDQLVKENLKLKEML